MALVQLPGKLKLTRPKVPAVVRPRPVVPADLFKAIPSVTSPLSQSKLAIRDLQKIAPLVAKLWDRRAPANPKDVGPLFGWPSANVFSVWTENTQDQGVTVEIHGSPTPKAAKELTSPMCSFQVGAGERIIRGCNSMLGDQWAPYPFLRIFNSDGVAATHGKVLAYGMTPHPQLTNLPTLHGAVTG